ncbi:hypothetical protein [Oceaniferula spumae]
MKHHPYTTLLAAALLPITSLHADNDEALVQTAMSKIDSEIKAEHYDLVMADLDNDGDKDALALMNGKSGYCGSGGCTLFVLRSQKAGFHKVGAVSVVSRPIYLRKSSHNSMRDLLVQVRGGGATPGMAALAFDGKSYPISPGDKFDQVTETDKILFADPLAKDGAEVFDRTLKLQGISFRVVSPNKKDGNSVTITPAGLEIANEAMTDQVKGVVINAESADLNADGSPEIYVFVKGADDKAALVAYGTNNKKSMSPIYLPSLDAGTKNAQGYRGGDELAVVETTLVRRFPLYSDDSVEVTPTGKMRQIQYKLEAGEAGWVLRVDKVVEF